MKIISDIFGDLFGYIFHLCYIIVNNYGAAIIIFTIVTKIIVFPFSVWTHKNSIRLLQINPTLSVIKKRYSGDKNRINNESYKIYKENKYNPFISLIPIVIQLFLFVGITQILYHPLRYVLNADQNDINVIINITLDTTAISNSNREELEVFRMLLNSNQSLIHYEQYESNKVDNILTLSKEINPILLGFDLTKTPSINSLSLESILALFSGVSSLVLCVIQNTKSPGALTQSKNVNTAATIITVLLTIYFSLITPIAFSIYLILNNSLSIISVALLNAIQNPKIIASEAYNLLTSRLSKAEIKQERIRKKLRAKREKIDAKRFSVAKKKVVFFALTGGQYKFYMTYIDYITDHSDMIIHYLTNDANDPLLYNHHEKVIPYYSGQRKTISLMMRMETEILITTVPDIQSFHIKRSLVKDDIEYIYTFHGMGSTHMVLRASALDYFDTIFCVGPHQVEEIRYREDLEKLPKKKLVKTGYGLYDQLKMKAVEYKKTEERYKILIAPSWQEDNIIEKGIDEIINSLIGYGYKLVIRPHPQHLQLFPKQIEDCIQRYDEFVSKGEMEFELDYIENSSIFTSDILITDWSSIAYEYSFCTKNPTLFIDTPMKEMNTDWQKYGITPIEISLRDIIGKSLSLEHLNKAGSIVKYMIDHKEIYKEKIEETIATTIYYPGRNGEAGGKYIINNIKGKENMNE